MIRLLILSELDTVIFFIFTLSDTFSHTRSPSPPPPHPPAHTPFSSIHHPPSSSSSSSSTIIHHHHHHHHPPPSSSSTIIHHHHHHHHHPPPSTLQEYDQSGGSDVDSDCERPPHTTHPHLAQPTYTLNGLNNNAGGERDYLPGLGLPSTVSEVPPFPFPSFPYLRPTPPC